MKLMPSMHTDGSCIKPVSKIDQARIYIGLLWHARRNPLARLAIRAHVRVIRRGLG